MQRFGRSKIAWLPPLVRFSFASVSRSAEQLLIRFRPVTLTGGAV